MNCGHDKPLYFSIKTQNILSVIGNLIHKLLTKMQTGYSILEQIALKCLPAVERGIISSVFHANPLNVSSREWRGGRGVKCSLCFGTLWTINILLGAQVLTALFPESPLALFWEDISRLFKSTASYPVTCPYVCFTLFSCLHWLRCLYEGEQCVAI